MATKSPTIHIVLDTNALFTEHIDQLLAAGIAQFIKSEAPASGLSIEFHIPDVVEKERRRQMTARAIEIMPHVQKIEKLLGLKLVTTEIINDRVEAVIARDVKEFSLRQISADYNNVDWPDLVHKACFRLPPFSSGDKEKGFKDAVILESFAAFVAGKPKSHSSNIIVLLCADGEMSAAATERFSSNKVVHICKNLDDVRTIVNAVASNVSQEVADGYVEKASVLFWDQDNQKGLYNDWSVGQKITAAAQRHATDGWKIKVGRAMVPAATFIKKDGPKIYLKTAISAKVTGTRRTLRETPISPTIGQPSGGLLGNWDTSSLSATRAAASAAESAIFSTADLARLGASYTPNALGALGHGYERTYADQLNALAEYVETTAVADANYDVFWSATVAKNGRIIRPEFGEFKYSTVTWKAT